MKFKKRFMAHKEVQRYNYSLKKGIKIFKVKIPIKNIIIGSILICSSFIIPDFGIGMFFGICIMNTPNIKQGFKDGYFLIYKSLKFAKNTVKNKYDDWKYKNA